MQTSQRDSPDSGIPPGMLNAFSQQKKGPGIVGASPEGFDERIGVHPELENLGMLRPWRAQSPSRDLRGLQGSCRGILTRELQGMGSEGGIWVDFGQELFPVKVAVPWLEFFHGFPIPGSVQGQDGHRDRWNQETFEVLPTQPIPRFHILNNEPKFLSFCLKKTQILGSSSHSAMKPRPPKLILKLLTLHLKLAIKY